MERVLEPPEGALALKRSAQAFACAAVADALGESIMS